MYHKLSSPHDFLWQEEKPFEASAFILLALLGARNILMKAVMSVLEELQITKSEDVSQQKQVSLK